VNSPDFSASAASLKRLGQSQRPRILFVSHNLGGGTERHIHDLAAMLESRCEILLLKPADERNLSLAWLRKGETFSAWFGASGDYAYLVEFLKSLGVARVHLHHVDGLPQSILTLAATLAVPLDVTLHDHFPMSPRYHLDPGGAAPSGPVDNRWGWNEGEWRRRMGAFLTSADRVICPSRYLQEQVRAIFPAQGTELWPHPEPSHAARIKPRKVLILGRTTSTKGLDVVEACARNARERGLPLFFKIVGPTDRPVPVMPELPLEVHGSYRDEDLAWLVASERGDAFLFPSQVPESFSYTLSCALASGQPVVASRLGAFIERLESLPRAVLMDWNSPAAAWNDALLDVARRQSPDQSLAAIDGYWQEYRTRYLAPLSDAPAVSGQPVLKPLFLQPPKILGAMEKSLPELLVAGVECGQEESLRELKRRTALVDTELAEARRSAEAAHVVLHQRDQDVEQLGRELQEAHQRYLSLEREMEVLRNVLFDTQERLESERDAARAAYLGIEQSTSWKITAPLRSVVQSLRSLRYRLSDLRGDARRLPQQINVARQILKEQGPAALGRRVQDKLTRKTETRVVEPVYTLETAIAPLTVPRSVKPRFSIIVPVYEQHLLTYTCLKSIAATCATQAIEVIVIDDCSPTPAAEALQGVEGVTFVRNEVNLGFLRNCNKAATLANGEYIVLLNNDTIVTGDWLGAMQAVFERFETAGMVGAKLIYPDGVLQEAGGIVWRDASAWNLGRGDNAAKPEYNYVREVDYCSGACLMLPRALWQQLGGFDEHYVPAYYEDTDLAFRVREAGLRVFYQPAAVVVHFEGRSSGTDLTQGVKQHQVTNQRKLQERWREVLAKHRLNGLSPHLERDRAARRRVLVVDACMLTPDQDSGSLRMFEMLGLMRALDCKVTFVADNLEYREPYVSQIQQLGVEVLYYPHTASMTGLLERNAADYDVIMLSRVTVACKYVELVKRAAPRAKLVFDTVDLHFLRQQRQAELNPGAAALAAADAMKKQELDIIAQSDVTLVVSPVEQQLLDSLMPQSRIAVVSNVHVTMPGPAGFAERSGIIFIGGFRHPPNLDAITWYVEEVLPIVRRKSPGLVTTIIGSNAPPALQRFAADDFIIAGFVPDVTDAYGRARMSISPLRYGAGVKGKVNLSMQYGVPVVATSVSVEGMFLRDGVDVLVADEPEAFADAIVRLHADEALWGRLAAGGLRNIETHFSRACARSALSAVLELD